MQKEELIASIKTAIADGTLSEADITQLTSSFSPSSVPAAQFRVQERSLNITQALYYIGGAIVFIGIIVFIVQNWESLNSFARILVTLGAGLAGYLMGVLVYRSLPLRLVSYLGFILSAFLVPVGIAVTMNEMHINAGTAEAQTFISFISLILFGVSALLFRQAFFIGLSIVYGTWFYYAAVTMLGDFGWQTYAYLTVIAGLAYQIIGYGMARFSDDRARLKIPLYIFGLAGSLSALLALGGVWDALFSIVILALIYVSILLKSVTHLRLSALFLMAYIIKITAQHFSNNLGWPLALVFAGIALIGIGYLTHYLNKKYLHA